MRRSPLWPYVLVATAGTLWGTTFSLARLATEAGGAPLGLAFWQGFGGALVALALCVATRRKLPLDGEHLRFYFLLGLIGTALPAAIFFYAAPRVPAGILAITVATVPMMTYAASWLLGLDAPSTRRLAGLVVGFVAILALLGPESSLPERSMAMWVVAVLLASVFYTVENVFVAIRVPPGTDMLALLCGMLFAASLQIAPVALAADAFIVPAWPWGVVERSMLAMAIVSSLAYAIFLHVIHLSGPVFASQIGYVVTLSGVFWAMLVFQETHSHWVWAALALMLAGLALVTPWSRPLPA